MFVESAELFKPQPGQEGPPGAEFTQKKNAMHVDMFRHAFAHAVALSVAGSGELRYTMVLPRILQLAPMKFATVSAGAAFGAE